MRHPGRTALIQLLVMLAVAASPAPSGAQANIRFDGLSESISGTTIQVASTRMGSPSFFVRLLDATNALIHNYTVLTTVGPVGPFVEGRFVYDGPESVGSAIISFQQAQRYTQFAIDNITTAPEPASLVLVATGLVAVFGVVRRRATARHRVVRRRHPHRPGSDDAGRLAAVASPPGVTA
ncbi:MAG: PEP-CTERM sorting domain-containing protein [Gemmatimonadaceae bacterium]